MRCRYSLSPGAHRTPPDSAPSFSNLAISNRRVAHVLSAAHDLQPEFSPDGERIVFRSDRHGGDVFLMTASGESVTRLTDFGYFPSWSPDGTEIVVSPGTFSDPAIIPLTATGLSVVAANTRHVRAVATPSRARHPA
mgnify:CR=1 FL=1